MNDLNRDAFALLRTGRSAFRPEASDRDKVLAALGQALGEGAITDGSHDAGSGGAKAAPRFALKGWIAGGLAAVTVGAGIGAAVHFGARAPSRGASFPETAIVTPPERAPAPIDTAAPSEPALPPAAAPVDSPLPAREERASRPASHGTPRAPSDSLVEEVRLIARAEQQMNDGLPDDALRTLAEHERRFPSGSLAEERTAARVHALCASGRAGEAAAELATFTRAYPRSPYLEKARKACEGRVP